MKNQIKRIFLLSKYFGFKYAIITLGTILFNKLNGDGYMAHFFHKKQYSMVVNWLEFKYEDIINKYKSFEDHSEYISNTSNIWVFWWQGMENMPPLVNACINNLKKKSGNRKVIILTQYNYCNYVNIPTFILNKVKNGTFTYTFFSDILRFALLGKYGGIWVDATLYVDKDLPDMNDYKFFTIKHGLFEEWHISGGRWSSFFMAVGNNNLGIRFIRDILLKYADTYDIWIAYLLTDAIMEVAYRNFPSFKRQIDNVPYNNKRVFQMVIDLNKSNDDYSCPTNLNKLTYKKRYRESKNTVYYALIHNILK